MGALSFYLTAALVLWLIILVLPWRPWMTKERWDASNSSEDEDLSDITILIPARNEAKVLPETIKSVLRQGEEHKIVIIDDNSTDATSEAARKAGSEHVNVIAGKPRPNGWSGKLWALEQGLKHVQSEYTLLLDADIKLRKGVIAGLKSRLQTENFSFLSLMAMPSLTNYWEKLLMPAFIYFFKLLYPFKLSNSSNKWVAAAAGGCIFTKTEVLNDIGGFEPLKEALIDDCTLAKIVKNQGYSTWVGLTHSAKSIRPYNGLKEIWNMVSRTAFTQLRYSIILLIICTLLMILAFAIPVVGITEYIFFHNTQQAGISILVLFIMCFTYIPVLRFYNLSPFYSLVFPLTGILFLGMTWTSAIRYWRGERMRWRGRIVREEVKLHG